MQLPLTGMVLALALGTTTAAQDACFEWPPEFRGSIVASGFVRTAALFDDGSGPALYVAGSFEEIGDVTAAHIARWDGAGWSEVGGGVGTVFGNENQPVPHRRPALHGPGKDAEPRGGRHEWRPPASS